MIKSFRHKGLKAFYLKGTTRGIDTKHGPKLRRILAALDAADEIGALQLPGFRLHQLKGKHKGCWSMTVNGNWGVVFRFVDTDVELVDYLDYH